MLILHVSGKWCRQQIYSTLLAVHHATLPFAKGDEALPTVVVHFPKERSPNLPGTQTMVTVLVVSRDANYGDCPGCVCVETNTFEQLNQGTGGSTK